MRGIRYERCVAADSALESALAFAQAKVKNAIIPVCMVKSQILAANVATPAVRLYASTSTQPTIT